MKITLVPTAGLGNRMNAIMHSIGVSFDLGCEIDIYWEKTNDCCADFTDLFKDLDIKKVSLQKLNKFYLKPGSKKNLYIPNLLKKLYFDASYVGRDTAQIDTHHLIDGKENVYISSYNRFSLPQYDSSKKNLGNVFKPNDLVEDKIKKITNQYSDYTIGIHIRRTDNKAAIANNPIEKFIINMDKEIEKNPSCSFYVASDSQEDKDFLKSKYGDRIIANNVVLARNSVEGMIDATVELYCLARTNKIYGCTNSTFTLIASRLYSVPLFI